DTGAATIDTAGSVGVLTAGSFDGGHVFADNGVFLVRVTVRDDDGDETSETFRVTVANAPPVLTAPAPQLGIRFLTTEFALSSFADAGERDGPWKVSVHWGDGSADTVFSTASRGALGTRPHAYADLGTYTVTVTVTDKDGDSAAQSFAVQ